MLVLDESKGLKLISLPFTLKKRRGGDFPGGPVVKNLPASAGNIDRFSLCSGKNPHATGQLSLCIATTEPTGCQLTEPKL